MKFGLLPILFLLVSCSTTDHILMTKKPLKPIPIEECNVRVYSEKPQDQHFIEVAMISSAGDNLVSGKGLTRNISKRACELGADAVVVGNFTSSNLIGGVIPGSGGNLQVLAIRLVE